SVHPKLSEFPLGCQRSFGRLIPEEPGAERVELRRIAWFFRLPELPAPEERVGEQRVGKSEILYPREVGCDVVFHQVLQKAGRDAIPKVFLWVVAPAANERPYRLWVRFDEIADCDDGLPAVVLCCVLDRLAGKECVGFTNRTSNIHRLACDS